MQERTFGDVRIRLAGGTDREGGGDGPLVVLMHGFGAPGTDLVPLYRQLDVPREVRFAFPEGPVRLEEELGPGYAGARAWWKLDLEALMNRAAQGGTGPDRSRELPAGLAAARDRVTAMLAEMETALGVPRSRTLLGGFSQGAMLALDVALHAPSPFAGLALLSGTLIALDEWEPLLPSLRGQRVLQSHGRTDAILPFGAAVRLRDLLRDAGADVRWIEFNGGHTITDGVVDDLGRLVRDVFASE